MNYGNRLALMPKMSEDRENGEEQWVSLPNSEVLRVTQGSSIVVLIEAAEFYIVSSTMSTTL